MMLKQIFLFVAIVSCRRITRRNTTYSSRNSLVALGSMNHGHTISDEAFFYDFLSLSIEFTKHNLDEFVRVNFKPTFAGFTDKQFDTLLQNWIFGMLDRGY